MASKTRNPRPSNERSNTANNVNSGNFGAQPAGGDVGYTIHTDAHYDRASFTTGKPIQGSRVPSAGNVGQMPSKSPQVNKGARDR